MLELEKAPDERESEKNSTLKQFSNVFISSEKKRGETRKEAASERVCV
jgi:hypothetical protein